MGLQGLWDKESRYGYFEARYEDTLLYPIRMQYTWLGYASVYNRTLITVQYTFIDSNETQSLLHTLNHSSRLRGNDYSIRIQVTIVLPQELSSSSRSSLYASPKFNLIFVTHFRTTVSLRSLTYLRQTKVVYIIMPVGLKRARDSVSPPPSRRKVASTTTSK